MKNKKIIIKVKPEDLHLRNELHFNIQKNTRAQVFADRRFKKPKHKNKIFEE